MRTILVPVDFSQHSENALKVAANLAQKNHAEIIVLHVMEIDEPLMGTGQYYVDDKKMVFFMKLTQKKFVEFLNKEYLKDLSITDLIEVGTPEHGIANMVKKHQVDFIVMGSKGASGLEEVLIGSNTENVVRNSEVPVMVIKNELKKTRIQKIIFACDFSREQLVPYQKANRFADDFNAELKLMYVNTPGEKFKNSQEITEKIHVFSNNAQLPYRIENVIVYNDYSIEKGILNGAHTNSADLIAMPTHGRKGLAHFFEGSIAEDVANHSNIPVITFKISDH